MGRRPRDDEPGAWHHVTNRALARRPLFEDQHDLRFFLSRLAREVRRGRLQVHAWCLMTTHFHLLVRSPTGQLAEAMRCVQNEYARHFNRRHRRDGTLLRGRFWSKRVRGLEYRRILVRYIDANPVAGGLCSHPWDYTWGSARDYVAERPRRWLSTEWIGPRLEPRLARGLSRIEAYRECFPPQSSPFIRWLLETQNHAALRSENDLVLDAPERILGWMRRKASLADGTTPGLRLGRPARAAELADRAVQLASRGEQDRDGTVLRVACVRLLAGATWAEVAKTTGVPRSSAHRLLDERHVTLIQREGWYASAFDRLARELVGEIVG